MIQVEKLAKTPNSHDQFITKRFVNSTYRDLVRYVQ